jgi:hypothetical protein
MRRSFSTPNEQTRAPFIIVQSGLAALRQVKLHPACKEGREIRMARSRRAFGRDDSMFYGIAREIRSGLQVQLTHELSFVEFYRLYGNV